MESPERLHRRIATLNDVATMVKTMKALSAVSIRQYEQAVLSLSDYYRTVELGLQVVLQNTANHRTREERQNDTGGLGVIVFGSDRGLCGRFNEDIAAYTLAQLDASQSEANSIRLLTVGARAAAELEQAGHRIEGEFLAPGTAVQITATVQQLLKKIDEWRAASDIHKVWLLYNRHASGHSYEPRRFRLLPAGLGRFQQHRATPWPSRRLPTFSMDRNRLLANLLRQYFFVSIFRACAESQASEHASRLASMQSAEKNLNEKTNELTTQFRRLRQDAITTELLDVVSGYEAVQNKDPAHQSGKSTG